MSCFFYRTVALCIVVAGFSLCTFAQAASDYDALLQKGNTQLQAGRAELALASGEAAVKMNGDRWEAYALAGGALMNLKRYEEAVDKLSEAIKRAPEMKQQGLRDLRRQCLHAELGTSVATESAPALTTQAEIVLWKSIENSTNPADFSAYLKQYPTGAFAPLATARQAKLDWNEIQNSMDSRDFTTFLQRFPNAEEADLARGRLAQLESRATDCGNRDRSIYAALRCLADLVTTEGQVVSTYSCHHQDCDFLVGKDIYQSKDITVDSSACEVRYTYSHTLEIETPPGKAQEAPKSKSETRTLRITDVGEISALSEAAFCAKKFTYRRSLNPKFKNLKNLSSKTCNPDPPEAFHVVSTRSEEPYALFSFHDKQSAETAAAALVSARALCNRGTAATQSLQK